MTVAAASTNFFGEPSPARRLWSPAWFRQFSVHALIGLIVLAVNFPKYLTAVIETNLDPSALRSALLGLVGAVQGVLRLLVGPDPGRFFERAMLLVFLLFWATLLFSAAFCIRKRDARPFAYLVAGTVAGYFTLHFLAWVAVAVVTVLGGAFFVFGWFGSVVAAIVGFIWANMLAIVLVLATGALFLFSIRQDAIEVLRRLWGLLRDRLLPVGILVGGVLAAIFGLPFLYRYVVQPVLAFLGSLLAPVFAAIWFVVKWLLIIVFGTIVFCLVAAVCALMLALLGGLLIAQLQAGWLAAQNVKRALIAGFAIGSSLALVVLVSVSTPGLRESLGDAWGSSLFWIGSTGSSDWLSRSFLAVLPSSVETFAFTYLTSLQAPAFDCLVLLAVLAFAATGYAARTISAAPVDEQPISVNVVALEYAKMILGLFVGLIVIFATAATGDSSA